MKQPSDMTDRELDAAVAVEVMGWPRRPPGFGGPQPPHVAEFVDGTYKVRTPNCNDWRPSTDIAAAWEVVEKMTGAGFKGSVMLPDTDSPPMSVNGNTYQVTLGTNGNWARAVSVSGNSIARTICLAALAAVRGRT